MRGSYTISLVAALAGAMVVVSSGSEVSAGAPQAARPERLPPMSARMPEVFTPDGCSWLAQPGTPGAKDCPATLDDERVGVARPANEVGEVAGFRGGIYRSRVTGLGVIVDEARVTTRPGEQGRWSAVGLVVNDTDATHSVGAVVATLYDAGGELVEEVSAPPLVTVPRPGEPVPFRLLASSSGWEQVAHVEWEVVSEPLRGPEPGRQFEILVHRELPYGPREELWPPGFSDPQGPGGNRAHLIFGSVRYLSSRAIRSPDVIVAWEDTDGRVLAARVAQIQILEAYRGRPIAGTPDNGVIIPFVAAVDDPEVAPLVTETLVTGSAWTIWAVGEAA